MKYLLVDTLQNFMSGEMDVARFRDTLETWNRTGLWEGLAEDEYKLLSHYFRYYFDMYAGEILPRLSGWERFKRDMQGEGNIDLAALKEATADLLRALEGYKKE